MDIGICVASHVKDIDYIVHAEELGYSHAWLADTQMLWSDCYAALALVADKTSRINIGTGVAVSGTRPASVSAAGIATINVLAPGRTFFGVGAGNTAMRVMGLPPQRIKDFDQYLSELKPLLKGEESMITEGDKKIPIRHIMPDKGFVNFDDEIPLYVSGFGPRSLALAGKYGDGGVLMFPSRRSVMKNIWGMIEKGAIESGRTIDHNQFYTTALTTIVVLDEGEEIDSDRVKQQCGAFAMSALHYAYDQYRNFGHQPSIRYAGVWDEYAKMLEEYPKERLHQRIHQGHNCWLLEEEERFVTKEIIETTCLVGTQDTILEKLHELSAAGLNQVMILPNFDPRYEVIERVAKDIIPNV